MSLSVVVSEEEGLFSEHKDYVVTRSLVPTNHLPLFSQPWISGRLMGGAR